MGENGNRQGLSVASQVAAYVNDEAEERVVAEEDSVAIGAGLPSVSAIATLQVIVLEAGGCSCYKSICKFEE